MGYEERAEAMLKRLHRNYEELGSEQALDVTRSAQTIICKCSNGTFENGPHNRTSHLWLGDFQRNLRHGNDIKAKQAELAAVNSRLNAIQRKRSGNLVTRDLSDLIRTDHYVRDPATKALSQKIVPYFIVVSVHKKEDFLNSYERFTQFVVPNSARHIPADDKDYMLYRILHLNATTMEDDLKTACEEQKFTFRKFQFDNMAVAKESTEEEQQLIVDQKKLTHDVVMHIKSIFSEMFVAYMHLKAIRVFVESVLWYSFPLDYAIMLVRPNESKEVALRNKLAEKFKGAKCSQVASQDDDDNHPYVSLDLDLGWLLGED